MRKKIFCLFVGLLPFSFFSQDFSGSWSGIIMQGGKNIQQGDIVYLNIEASGDNIQGLTRIELVNEENEFAVKSFQGEIKENKLKLTEDFIRRSSKTRKSPECKLEYELEYHSKTAYLTGKYRSSDCRNVQGEILLFRSDVEVNTGKEPPSSHAWKHFFVRNYEKGYPAPEILVLEQKNFKFKVIHFEYDKAEIKPEYFDYLNSLARILDAIHDLRVKITGHTDSDGTDVYNMELSERRAEVLRNYFRSRGVEPGKLEIDFKGKRQPIGSNKTKEGRKKNRRVVFEFI